MGKLVVLRLDGDSERQGFRVTLSIGEEEHRDGASAVGPGFRLEAIGHLPPAPELIEQLQNHCHTYRSLGAPYRLKPAKIIYDGLIGECQQSARVLRDRLNDWLKSDPFLDLDRRLREELNRSDEIRFLICTEDQPLQKLPWHLWDFFDRYPQAELGIGDLTFERIEPSQHTASNSKVRILAILGHSEGLDVEADRQLLENLPDADTTFLVEETRQKINDYLWEQPWDIIFFAGHSATEGEAGRIYLNPEESLTIDELTYALKTSVEQGLKVAIFNSCDGLGLALQLKALQIPQVIVMRELVPDQVAQAFLKYFLQSYASGQSFFLAEREARERLQGMEDRFPCASWLPIIYQNSAHAPPSWLQLVGLPTCPYRGLSAFQENDAPFFKGREAVATSLLATVKKRPLVPVVGASGSGKSSLILAGLIPRLRASGIQQIACFRPGNAPFEALATALLAINHPYEVEAGQLQGQIEATTTELRSNPSALPALIERIISLDSPATSLKEASDSRVRRLVLIADQFEELYTLCKDSECQVFLDCILQAIYHTPAFTFIFTLRVDFLGRAIAYHPFGKALQDYPPEFLLPMNQAELEQAIALPAENLQVQLEQGLTQRLIDEVGNQPGRLPLLEFALTQLWSKQQNRQLTHQAYEAIGGVEEALANYAESTYAQLSKPDRQRAKQVFLQLVRPGEGTEDTRRLATRTEIGVKNWDLVTQLASARLVVTNRNESTEEETVEIAHEALIQSWGRLGQWMKVDGEFRRWQEQLRIAMRQWESSGKDKDTLLRGKPLADAEEWQQQHPDDLSQPEQAFIQASLNYRDRQIRQDQRRVVVLRSMLAVVSGALAIALGFGVMAFKQSQMAQEQTAIKKATLVRNLLPTKPLEGLVQAIEMTGSSQSLLFGVPDEVEASLREAVHWAREEIIERNILQGHEGLVSAIAISPDGQIIVSASFDQTLRLWTIDGDPIGQPFQGHTAKVRSVAFSPSGQIIASSSDDKTVRLWDLQGNPIGQPFQGHQKAVFSVAFSPDGQTIVSGSFDKTLRLWDRQGNPISQPFKGHQDAVISVAFSPDGQTIASGSDDKTIRLWDRQGKPIGQPFQGHEDFVASVAFSPNGQTLVSGSFDKTVRLWNRQGQPLGQPFQGHQEFVSSVAFSPDGQIIVSGSFDKTLRLWTQNGTPIGQSLLGHEGVIRSVAISSDGQTIVSGGGDRTLRLWHGAQYTQQAGLQPFHGHQDTVTAVAFDPNGASIFSGSLDHTVRLWDLEGNALGVPLARQSQPIQSIALSPDGQWVATGSVDGTVQLWNRKGNPVGKPFRGHQKQVRAVAFSPDGQTIISGSDDRTLRLWNRQGQSLAEPLRGHEDVVLSVTFSPNGQQIASSSFDTTIRLWDRTGKPIGEPLRGHEGFVASVAFSPDGNTLVSGSDDQTLRLWNQAGKPIGEPLLGHERSVSSVAFSPDGQYIVSGSFDNTVRLWDRKGQPIGQPYRGHQQPVRSVAFSPDGQYIVSGSNDKTLQLWDTQSDWRTWLNTACNRLRHHAVLTRPRTEEAKVAQVTCRKFAWKRNRLRAVR